MITKYKITNNSKILILLVGLITTVNGKKPIIDLNDENNPNTLLFLAQSYNSGLFLFPGIEGKKSYNMALKYANLAAQKGSVEGAFYTGLLYEAGDEAENINPDRDKAIEYYEQAASKGHRKARLYLGELYLSNDLGSPKNYEKPVKYLQLAADQSNILNPMDREISIDAARNLGSLYQTEKISANKSDDYAQSINYLTIATQSGNDDDLIRLGFAYLLGQTKSGEPDYDKSYNYFSSTKNASGLLSLGMWYSIANAKYHKSADYKKALELFVTAGERGDILGYVCAGQFCLEGKTESLKPEYQLAYKFFDIAAQKGDAEAMYQIGLMYAKGIIKINKKIDAKTALSYLSVAAKKGHKLAMESIKAIAGGNNEEADEQ